MSELHKNFIGGEWLAGAKATRNVNPSNTNDIVGEYAHADAAQANAAIAAAKAAAPAWARSTPQERHDALKKVSDEILARKEELGELLLAQRQTLPQVRLGYGRRFGHDVGSLAKDEPAPCVRGEAAIGLAGLSFTQPRAGE